MDAQDRVPVKTEAEVGTMCLQAKGCQGPPEAGKGRTGASRGSVVLLRPTMGTSGLQNGERLHFGSLSPARFVALCYRGHGKLRSWMTSAPSIPCLSVLEF